MAKGPMMLQIAVEQLFSSAVMSVPEIWAVAVESLDGDRTIVREIATEKNQGVYAVNNDNFEFGILDLSPAAATDLWLVFPDLRRTPAILHAPSHVPSPPIDGARVAVLRVRDYGFTITTPGGPGLSLGRRVGSHAYLDEMEPS
jgi:hypothetical protein